MALIDQAKFDAQGCFLFQSWYVTNQYVTNQLTFGEKGRIHRLIVFETYVRDAGLIVKVNRVLDALTLVHPEIEFRASA